MSYPCEMTKVSTPGRPAAPLSAKVLVSDVVALVAWTRFPCGPLKVPDWNNVVFF